MEIADRERNDRKVRGRKQTMETEIMVNSPLMTGMLRIEQKNTIILNRL